MSFSFSGLFKSKSPAGDGLTQPQREAIADLLHFCIYADNHVAQSEIALIDRVAATFTWDPKMSFETFEARSIAAARQAKENPGSSEDFLQSVRERLNQPEARARALDLCMKLFAADQNQSEQESALLARIRRALA